MALLNTDAPFSPSLRARLDTFFAGIGMGLNAYMESRSRMHEINRLNALSDAALKSMGLKREDIPRHVFRDLFYL
ncbi:hypothetical protein [Oceanicola sp. 502str15]|uniref:hypothetical protein n=1 Tax=Oceanicola sp. 502str15 TaxID=2696061 RepID=UPI0020943AE6|nr:hypothetical protein [Oceanicola sp. 502str15]MCO6383177.1 hypothetical protein [Oceanicola sp. 502str15]